MTGRYQWVEQQGGKMICPDCQRVFEEFPDDLTIWIRVKPAELSQAHRPGCTSMRHHKCGTMLEKMQRPRRQAA